MRGPLFFRWLASRTIREATDALKRSERTLKAQQDILSPAAVDGIRASSHDLQVALKDGSPIPTIKEKTSSLEAAANKWFRPYPSAAIREQIDVLLVALTVAMAVRTFFFQPMAIPTGSMQPTLYGITHEDLRGKNVEIPGAVARQFDRWFKGISYVHVVAKADGVLEGVEQVKTLFPFIQKQSFKIGPEIYTVWNPPDQLFGGQNNRAGLIPGQSIFKKGDDVIKLKVRAGDRLFADRFTYNFRRPARGEIIIFETTGIDKLMQNTHYIKRLVGLPGETIQIGDDRHVVINGNRLTASTPRFENIYSFNGPPVDSEYSGHVNQRSYLQELAKKYDIERLQLDATYFPNGDATYTIPPGHYFSLGDNTMNSYDSRYWGSFPKEKVIGKCGFVFWPFSERFGWGIH
ncbi:MAG: signal peptidase I [Verrucomicrobiales bacterium]